MSASTTQTNVLYVKKKDAKAVKIALERNDLINKRFRMTAASHNADCIAIPIHQNESFINAEENGDWTTLIIDRGIQECPYSSAMLGNNRLLVQGNFTLVQQGLVNYLASIERKRPRDDIEQEVFALDIETCPKKLEIIGDDRTLVIPRRAFSVENSAGFAALVANDDLTDLWKHLALVHNSPRVVQRGDIDPNSGIRESGCRLLWPFSGIPGETGPGSPGWITITEQGIRQSFDMTRVMFSRGNITEKIRFGQLVQEGEIVLDMYAGIGYYTLPALVHGKAAHVYACEWNKHAASALQHNLEANGVSDRATVFVGDCRRSAKESDLVNLVDRVSLGLLPSGEGGWRTAIRALRRRTGGVLHIHGNLPPTEVECWKFWVCKTLLNLVDEELSSELWVVHCHHVEHVKSFAPKIDHYVADIFVGPNKGAEEEEGGGRCSVLQHGDWVSCPPDIEPPSCALSRNGVLNQEWMMEDF